MKFLLDESVDVRLAHYLTFFDHDVTAIAPDYPNALSDTEVLQIAVREERILITNDRDFGELIFRHHLPHRGVIYLRLRTVDLGFAQSRLGDLLTRYQEQMDNFFAVTNQRIRIRRAELS